MVGQRVSRDNNFDLIRLLAASQVLIGHSFLHLEINNGDIGFLNLFPGVLIFFVISGFLITSSLDNNIDNLKQYVRNRFLRIFPAIWMNYICLMVLLFAFGIVSFQTFKNLPFLFWNFGYNTIFQFYTPDVLRGFGVSAPNGSLWTIPVELSFYLLLPLLFLLSFRLSKAFNLNKKIILVIICLLFSIASIVANYWMPNKDSTLGKLFSCSLIPYLYSFLLGGIIYISWDKVKLWFEGKFVVWLSLYLVLCLLFKIHPAYSLMGGGNLLANIVLSCVTISAAFTSPKLGKILKGYDISYGVYIYHMLVINSFVQIGFTGSITSLVLSLLLTFILGFLSWILIERKALSQKKKSIIKK